MLTVRCFARRSDPVRDEGVMALLRAPEGVRAPLGDGGKNSDDDDESGEPSGAAASASAVADTPNG